MLVEPEAHSATGPTEHRANVSRLRSIVLVLVEPEDPGQGEVGLSLVSEETLTFARELPGDAFGISIQNGSKCCARRSHIKPN